MKSIRFGLALGAALLVAPLGANAGDDDTSIASDGSTVTVSEAAFGMNPYVSRSYSGSGESGLLDGVSMNKESKDDIWALWGLEPVTAPVGTESIIGPDQRKRVKKTKKYPARAVVLITFSAGRCTGWMISKDTVATAGHCVHQGSGGSNGFYPTGSYKVYPGRNGNKAPYGSCTAKNTYTVTGWADSGKDDYDYGAIKLNCKIGKKVGWFGYFWKKGSLTGLPTIISGYPGDKPLTMWKSTGPVTVTQTRRVFYQNDTTGGMSGSPVYYKRKGCGWCSMAVHAYGIYGSPPFSNNNHGTRITKVVYKNLNAWKK